MGGTCCEPGLHHVCAEEALAYPVDVRAPSLGQACEWGLEQVLALSPVLGPAPSPQVPVISREALLCLT